jgi:hypothetical protein
MEGSLKYVKVETLHCSCWSCNFSTTEHAYEENIPYKSSLSCCICCNREHNLGLKSQKSFKQKCIKRLSC